MKLRVLQFTLLGVVIAVVAVTALGHQSVINAAPAAMSSALPLEVQPAPAPVAEATTAPAPPTAAPPAAPAAPVVVPKAAPPAPVVVAPAPVASASSPRLADIQIDTNLWQFAVPIRPNLAGQPAYLYNSAGVLYQVGTVGGPVTIYRYTLIGGQRYWLVSDWGYVKAF